MPSRYLIYALSDPRTHEIRYVGMSSSGLRRPRQHVVFSNREKTYKSNWIRSLLRCGLEPEIEIVEELFSKDDLPEAECFWISQFRCLGFRLTNLTDGGDGRSGFVPSKESRTKCSLSNKGRKPTPSTRTAVSASNKRRKGELKPHSEEHKIAISRSRGGRPILETTTNTRFETVQQAARDLSLFHGNIRSVLLGKHTQTKGYRFVYLDK